MYKVKTEDFSLSSDCVRGADGIHTCRTEIKIPDGSGNAGNFVGSGCYAVSRKREDGNVAAPATTTTAAPTTTTSAPTTTVAPTSTSVEIARYSTITATDVTFTCDASQADCPRTDAG